VHDVNWAVHAYCLMDNHYHLLIETPEGNLSKGVRHLNGVYTQRFNCRLGEWGMYSRAVTRRSCAEGIVHVGIGPLCCAQSGQGSYGAHSGPMVMEQLSRHSEEAPPWRIDWLLAAFSAHRSEAIRRYMDFVADGRNQPGPWEKLKNQIFLGYDEFVASLQRTLDPDASYQEIPAAQRRPLPRPLAQIV
jgi:REP element-mobilizing transposase RayT